MKSQTTPVENQLVVVTGGSRGIGYQIAKSYLARKSTVIITGRNRESLNDAAGRLGDNCHAIVCDQTDSGQVRAFADEVLTRHGAPHVLVANAGIMQSRPLAEMDEEMFERVIDVNLTGTYRVCKALVPAMMKEQRGDVFLMASMSGKKGDPGAMAYSASKFGLQGMAQAMNHDVRRSNIRVMVVNPSSVDTHESTAEGPLSGPGLRLHAKDIAETLVHLSCLPSRTLFRDMEVWGTNPFPAE